MSRQSLVDDEIGGSIAPEQSCCMTFPQYIPGGVFLAVHPNQNFYL